MGDSRSIRFRARYVGSGLYVEPMDSKLGYELDDLNSEWQQRFIHFFLKTANSAGKKEKWFLRAEQSNTPRYRIVSALDVRDEIEDRYGRHKRVSLNALVSPLTAQNCFLG